MQAVSCDQPAIPIRALHEFISKTGTPLRGKLRSLRQSPHIEPSRLFSANLHGESVVETKSGTYSESKPSLIFSLHALKYVALVAGYGLLENCRQSGARVFGIDIDASGEHRLLTNVGSCQVKAPLDFKISARFDLLRNQFAEDERLSEVLGSDHNAVRMGRRTGRKEKTAQHQGRQLSKTDHRGLSRFSIHPTPKSASSARTAAGMAPARITRLSTMANPRKMNSPKPPAPIAAAMVANPTDITTAILTPERMTLTASGNST